jgi:hypothetical protein
MRSGEAKRLALLTILHDVGASLDTSDEWLRHPETDAVYTREERLKVRAKATDFLGELERRVVHGKRST